MDTRLIMPQRLCTPLAATWHQMGRGPTASSAQRKDSKPKDFIPRRAEAAVLNLGLDCLRATAAFIVRLSPMLAPL